MTNKNINEILVSLGAVKKDTEYLKERIDKINGNLNDYSVYKERVDKNCESLEKIEPIVTNMRIKIYGISAAIGMVTGGIMGTIGIFIGRAIGG